MPRPNPGQQGLKSDVAVPVAVAATKLCKLRDNAVPVGSSAWNTAQRLVQLKLPDAGILTGVLLGAEHVLDGLDLRRGVGVDGGGIHGTIIPQLINIAVGSAAAVGQLALHLKCPAVNLRGQGGRAGTQIALVLERELGLLVEATAHSVLQIVKVHCIAQACLGDRLTAAATIPPAAEAAAPHHREQEQGENPEESAIAETKAVIATVSIGYSGNVSQRNIRIHIFSPFEKIKFIITAAPGTTEINKQKRADYRENLDSWPQ